MTKTDKFDYSNGKPGSRGAGYNQFNNHSGDLGEVLNEGEEGGYTRE